MTALPDRGESGEEQARWRRIRDIFAIATDAGSSDRHEIVRSLCGSDASLLKQVEDLLALREQTGLALDRRVVPVQESSPEAGGRHQAGEVIGEQYRIVRFLARGGMGEVYEAVALETGLPAALKFVRHESGDAVRADSRFLREIHLTRKIDHPNVCRIHDLGEHHGEYYCSMELLEGETLAERLRRVGKLPPAEALPVALQICDGLTAAHRAGVFHRDLKPSNIFLTKAGRAVIIDFGLAAAHAAPLATEESLTASGVVIGTLAYIAPEQLEDGKGSAQADLYSLGVILYEMVTGEKPHDARSPFRLAAQKTSEAHTESSASIVAMPAVWREVITRCLKAEPAERYSEASGVRQALERRRPSLRFLAIRRGVLVPAAIVLMGATGWGGWMLATRDHKPSADAARLYASGYYALTAAAPMSAIRDLEKAVAADPQFLKAQALLAVAQAEVDQPEKSKDALLQAIAIKNSQWIVGRGDGLALDASNAAVTHDYARAAEAYRQLARVAGNREFATLSLAAMLQQSGRFDGAIATLESAIKESPEAPFVPAARVRLAGLYSRKPKDTRAEGEYAQAEAAYRKSGNQEGLCDLWIARALAVNTRSAEQDREDLDRAIELSGRLGNRYQNLTAKLRMVNLLELEHRYAEAADFARDLAEEARREGMLRLAANATADHGYALVYLKKFAEAEPILREAIGMAERAKSPALLASIRWRLGEVLANNRREVEAAGIMEPAVNWYRKDGGASGLPLILIKWGGVLTILPGRTAEAPKYFLEAHDLALANHQLMLQNMALMRLTDYYGVRDLRKAREYGEKGASLAQETILTKAISSRGWILLESGDFAAAERVRREAVRQAREKQRPVDQPPLLQAVAQQAAAALFLQGRCEDAATAAKNLDASALSNINLVARSQACAGLAPASLRLELARLESRMKREQGWFRAWTAVAAGDVALHARDWQAAARDARLAIEVSRNLDITKYELESSLILRAAEFQMGNRAEAERLSGEVLRLSRKFGFDQPEQFGGRKDLFYFWNLGHPAPK